MSNEEIYQKLSEQFNESDMGLVCDIVSTLYDIKFQTTRNFDAHLEFDYQRQWWFEKHNSLINKEENACQE